jgi:hypothetical protein
MTVIALTEVEMLKAANDLCEMRGQDPDGSPGMRVCHTNRRAALNEIREMAQVLQVIAAAHDARPE